MAVPWVVCGIYHHMVASSLKACLNLVVLKRRSETEEAVVFAEGASARLLRPRHPPQAVGVWEVPGESQGPWESHDNQESYRSQCYVSCQTWFPSCTPHSARAIPFIHQDP